ncbi:MAG: VOC family protein [Chloroflexi bacterium]|nr:VOC family protein [Anaerolineaceae bacterium]NMB90956.1 VOC family protein [Chloroflexota bacterium]
MARVVHFEIPTTDAAASRKFYENVFGWQFNKYEGPVDYWLITTGPTGESGINGGMGGAANDLQGTVNTVGVANLDETLRQVLAYGGEVIMPKNEIPTVGWLAYVREPGGVVFGILEPLPGSTM